MTDVYELVLSLMRKHELWYLALLALYIFVAKYNALQWRLKNFETKYIRPISEKRDSFLKLIGFFLLAGFLAAFDQLVHTHTNNNELGRLVFDLIALLMAAIGFFFTVYGLRGVLDRPGNIDDVLIRTTALVNNYKKQHGYTIVMLCEYPAWGSLSRQPSSEYAQFIATIQEFLVEPELAKKRKIILVAPSENEMQKRIGQYSEDYEEQSRKTSAIEGNKELISALTKILPMGFNHWMVDTVPRYQMLLIGQNITANLFRPMEAIVWMASLSSSISRTSQSSSAGHQEQVPNRVIEAEREVSVLAWQTTDRKLLNQLYDSALHYAKLAEPIKATEESFLRISE